MGLSENRKEPAGQSLVAEGMGSRSELGWKPGCRRGSSLRGFSVDNVVQFRPLALMRRPAAHVPAALRVITRRQG